MQGCVVPAIIGTMTSSDFSHHIALDFPDWVIPRLLDFFLSLTLCFIPRLGCFRFYRDDMRPPQFLQVLW